MLHRIKSERERAGLSVEHVSDTLGVHQNTVRGWERGEYEPTSKNIVQLTALYGCSADYLLGLSEERKGE